jgi:hypothetical protein
LPPSALVCDLCVGEILVFADEVDDIHAETIAAFVEPESHDIMDGLYDRRVFPVEIWLLGGV